MQKQGVRNVLGHHCTYLNYKTAFRHETLLVSHTIFVEHNVV